MILVGNYLQETFKTKIGGEYDVIVIGGGPAGSCAAIAAARTGARTLVIERLLYLGGMWTGGLVNPLFDSYGKQGLLRELIRDLKKIGSWGGFNASSFGYENMKRLLEENLIGADGDMLLQTQFARLICENNKAVAVAVENKDGRTVYRGRVFIDCTGDADAVVSAGLPTMIGRDSDHLCQAMTLMFTIGNVDFIQRNCDELREMIEEALQKGETSYKLPYSRPYIIQIPNSRTAVVQLTHMRRYNPTSAVDIGCAAAEGRRQAYEVTEFLRSNIERFSDIELLETAPLLGIRESRRIIGEYILTKEDLSEGKRFDDEITTATFGIDIHDPLEDTQQCYPVKRYGIPYRTLIPKGIEGLLVAGRCISGTSEALASYRVTGNCAAMGEAAGIAASIAACQNIGVRDVRPEDILKYIN